MVGVYVFVCGVVVNTVLCVVNVLQKYTNVTHAVPFERRAYSVVFTGVSPPLQQRTDYARGSNGTPNPRSQECLLCCAVRPLLRLFHGPLCVCCEICEISHCKRRTREDLNESNEI